MSQRFFTAMLRPLTLTFFHLVSSSTPMLAPHLGASPDGKVVDPNEEPPYGLVEVKCPDVKEIGEASHIEFVGGQAKLRKKNTYHWPMSKVS